MSADPVGSLALLALLLGLLVAVALDDGETSSRARSTRIAWAALAACAVVLGCAAAEGLAALLDRW